MAVLSPFQRLPTAVSIKKSNTCRVAVGRMVTRPIDSTEADRPEVREANRHRLLTDGVPLGQLSKFGILDHLRVSSLGEVLEHLVLRHEEFCCEEVRFGLVRIHARGRLWAP